MALWRDELRESKDEENGRCGTPPSKPLLSFRAEIRANAKIVLAARKRSIVIITGNGSESWSRPIQEVEDENENCHLPAHGRLVAGLHNDENCEKHENDQRL